MVVGVVVRVVFGVVVGRLVEVVAARLGVVVRFVVEVVVIEGGGYGLEVVFCDATFYDFNEIRPKLS